MNSNHNSWNKNNPFLLDNFRFSPNTQINVSTNKNSTKNKNKNDILVEKTSQKILMSPGENATTTVLDSRISTDQIYEQLPQPTTPTNYLVSSYYQNGSRDRLNNFLPTTTTTTVETNRTITIPSIVETRINSSKFIPYKPHSSKKRNPNYVVGSNDKFPKKKFVRYFTGETSRQQQQKITPQNLEYMMIGSTKPLFEGSGISPSLIIMPNVVFSEEIKDSVDKLKSSISKLTYSSGPKDPEIRKKVEKAFIIIKYEIEKAKTEDEILEILDKFLIDRYPYFRIKKTNNMIYTTNRKPKSTNAKTQSNSIQKKNVETQSNNVYKKSNLPREPISTSAGLNFSFTVPRSQNIKIQSMDDMLPSTVKPIGIVYQGKVPNLYAIREISYRKSTTDKVGLNYQLFIGSNILNSIINLKFEIPTNIKNRSGQQKRLHKVLSQLSKLTIEDESQKMLIENSFLALKKELEGAKNGKEADEIIKKKIKSASSFPYFSYLYVYDFLPQDKKNTETTNLNPTPSQNKPTNLNLLPLEKITTNDLNSMFQEYNKQRQQQPPFYWQSNF
jgi:hypothetical protein